MKYLIVLIFLPHIIYSQALILVDSITGIPVENASVYSKNSDVGSVSDINGRVEIFNFNEFETITIQHVTYNSKKIKLPHSGIKVLLSPKSFILPTVTLNNNQKLLTSSIKSIIRKKVFLLESIEGNSSDLMENTGFVSVQKSQSGGGSPNFRGMEANRLLIVVDGRSLNNAISRSGHLQISSTINPFFLNDFSVYSGPSAVAFGDGAMGSALVFNTLSPILNVQHKILTTQTYESSSNTVALNYKSHYSKKNSAHVSAFSIKSVGNLKMGENRIHGYEDWGKENISVIGNEQLYTNYYSYDFLHKSYLTLNNRSSFLINTQYYNSSKINRFDKLNDFSNGARKYLEWYYGPQKRFFQSFKYQNKLHSILCDTLVLDFSFQNVKESRHHKKNNTLLKSNRYENLNIFDAGIDLKKHLTRFELVYGIGLRKQSVNSTANLESADGLFFENTTRYPNGGSLINNSFVYTQINFVISKKHELNIGGRGDYNDLSAEFIENGVYSFPYSAINNKNLSFVFSSTLKSKISSNFITNCSFYSGYRNPNIDDIGKVFSKNDKTVIIPNPELKPEKSNNIEAGLVYSFRKKLHFNIQFFNSYIINAIKRSNSNLNGDTMLLYDGLMTRIQMNKNIASANIYGVNFMWIYNLNKKWLLKSACNYVKGIDNENIPLSHIPPLNLKLDAKYNFKNQYVLLNLKYTAWKYANEYDLAGVDNLEEATVDGNPSWHTINLYYNNKLTRSIDVIIGLENIMDVHYKHFGSGLSSSGRNFTVSLQSKL